MKSKARKDSTIAVEEYMPVLSPVYLQRFKKLVAKIGKSLPINRNQIIDTAIKQIGIESISDCENIELLKYR